MQQKKFEGQKNVHSPFSFLFFYFLHFCWLVVLTFFAFYITWRWQWLHVSEKALLSSAETTTKWQTSAAWKHLWPSLTLAQTLIWVLLIPVPIEGFLHCQELMGHVMYPLDTFCLFLWNGFCVFVCVWAGGGVKRMLYISGRSQDFITTEVHEARTKIFSPCKMNEG